MNSKLIVRICAIVCVLSIIVLAVYHILFGRLGGNTVFYYVIVFIIVGSLSGCILFDEK